MVDGDQAVRICIITSGRRAAEVSPGHPITMHTYYLAKHLLRTGHDVEMITFPVRDRHGVPYPVWEVGWPRLPQGRERLIYSSYVVNEVTFAAGATRLLRRRHRVSPFDVAYFEDRIAAFCALALPGAQNDLPLLIWHGGPVAVQAGASRPGAGNGRPTGFSSPVISAVSRTTQRWIYRHGVRVVCQSTYLRDAIIASLGAPPAQVGVMPATIDAEVFHPGMDPAPIRERFKLQARRVVLCLGVVHDYKNHMAILRAAPAVLRAEPSTLFLFAGPVTSPGYFATLNSYARAHNLAGHVLFTGAIDHYLLLPPFYAAADLYVLPSLAEGGVPATALEAMSSGTPTILSSIPQIAGMLPARSGVTLVDPHDHVRLAREIVRLLQDDGARKEAAAAGRQCVLESFDWRVNVHVMVKLFEKAKHGESLAPS